MEGIIIVNQVSVPACVIFFTFTLLLRILLKGKMQLMEHDALGVVGPAILFCQTTIYVKALFLNECSLFNTLQTKAFHG